VTAVAARGLAILGGGRWARVLAGLAETLLPPDRPLLLCSPGNPAGWDGWLAATARRPRQARAVQIDALLGDPEASHVVIARRAADHAASTLDCLAAGKAVQVEKPFCVSEEECRAVLSAAGGRLCRTGHVMLFASNLRRFAEACRAAGRPARIDIDWSDPAAEVRQGAVKRHDPGLNVVQDVAPHLWSLLHLLCPGAAPVLAGVEVAGGGWSVRLRLELGVAEVSATMRRGHARRVRSIRLAGPGLDATMDFTTEPGLAVLNGRPVDVATGFAGPLGLQLADFLRADRPDPPEAPVTVQAGAAAIRLALAALPAVRAAQAAALADGFAHGAGPQVRENAARAVEEVACAGRDALRAGNPAGTGPPDAPPEWLAAGMTAQGWAGLPAAAQAALRAGCAAAKAFPDAGYPALRG